MFGTIDKLLDERVGVSDSINHANGVLISTESGKFAHWMEYFNDFYNRPDPLGHDHAIGGASTSTASPNIDAAAPTIDEVQKAITKLKAGKSSGPDRITAEMLRLGGDVVATALHKILCRVWEDEELPQTWKDATVVPVCKKKGQQECSNDRQSSGRYSCWSSDHRSKITGKGEQGNSRPNSLVVWMCGPDFLSPSGL